MYLKYVDRFPQLYSDRFIVEFSVIVDEAISHLKFMFGTSAHPAAYHPRAQPSQFDTKIFTLTETLKKMSYTKLFYFDKNATLLFI